MTGYESTRNIRTVESERSLAYEHQNLIQSPSPPANATSFPFSIFSGSSSSSANSPSAFNPLALDMSLSEPRLQLNSPALIIALTGFNSQKDQELAFEAGMDIFLTKPVRFREIGKILDGWRASQEVEAREKREKEMRDQEMGEKKESTTGKGSWMRR
jgi:CheY-like chemotaxis protein